jgi:integrase
MEEVAQGVFKHREGNWGFRADEDRRGKRRQVKRVGYPSKMAASRARHAFLGGNPAAAKLSDLTVSEWFTIRLRVIRETLRPTTASNYKFAFDRINQHVGEVALADLTEELVREMYRKMALHYSTDTISTTHGRLRAALRAAVKENYVSRCVADNVTPPAGQPTRARRTWDFQQLQTFSNHVVGQRDSAMWITWITTGLRRGEMCGLMWSKVSFDLGEITVNWQRTLTAENQIVEGPTKTKSGIRVVPINAQVVGALREWRSLQAAQRLVGGGEWAGSEYVFTTQEGRPYHPSSFDDRLAKLAKGAGLPPLTPHELRHTFASRCLEMNMPVKLVSSMLGHSKVETTQNLYQHINPAVAHREADALAQMMLG